MSFAEPRFRTQERAIDATTAVIAVDGEIHLSTAPELSQVLAAALDAGRTRLVLDLSGVMFIDSTGLAALLTSLRRITRVNGALALVCTSPTVLRLFEITNLTSTFAIYDAVEPALQAVAAQAAGASDAGAP